MKIHVDLMIQFFEDGDAFRNTHNLAHSEVLIEDEVLNDEDYLAETLAAHFSKEIAAIIDKEYGGASYEVMGVDYDEGYASLRIDIEE